MQRQRNPGRRDGIEVERHPGSLKDSVFTIAAVCKAVASWPRIPLRFIRATVPAHPVHCRPKSKNRPYLNICLHDGRLAATLDCALSQERTE